MGAYVVLARLRHKPMGPVVALIVINLVIGFTGNIEWQAHIGGLLIGAVLALAFHYASTLRRGAGHRSDGGGERVTLACWSAPDDRRTGARQRLLGRGSRPQARLDHRGHESEPINRVLSSRHFTSQ